MPLVQINYRTFRDCLNSFERVHFRAFIARGTS
jgi:hypothetical protein